MCGRRAQAQRVRDMSNPVDLLLDKVDWREIPPPSDNDEMLPYLTHRGELRIGDMTLECGVLNTGQRIFFGEAMDELVASMKHIESAP